MNRRILGSLLVASACWTGAAARAETGSSDQASAELASLNQPFSLKGADLTGGSTDLAAASLAMFGQPAEGEGPIVTDRPGFSDSAALVPVGRLQIEGGYTYTRNRENNVDSDHHTFPELALRYSVTDWLELRTKWNGWSITDLDYTQQRYGIHHDVSDSEEGCTDISFGVKIPLLKQDGWMPNLAVIPTIGVPTGKDSVSGTHHLVPEIKFPWNYALNDMWTVYGSVLGRVQDANESQFWQTAVTLAGAYQATDYMKLYVEYYGVYPELQGQDCDHFVSAGPIFKLSDDISMDLRAGMGINEEAPDFQASIGFGIRL